MATAAKDLLGRAATVLNDAGAVRWTVQELVQWLNEGQLVAVTQMPSINAQHQDIDTVAGPLQAVTGVVSLMDVVGNATGKRNAITPIKQELLDNQVRGWQGMPQSSEIYHWMRDARDPLRFLVYPPAKAGVKISLLVAAFPVAVAVPAVGTAIDAVTGDIGIRDEFATALVDYIVYRALSKDAEFGGNAQRTLAHYAMFSQGIGSKFSADVAATQQQGAAS